MATALVGVTCMVTTGAAARAADDSDSPLYSAPFADPVAAAADFGLADGRTERPLGSGSATWSPGALTVELDGSSQTLLEPDWGDGTIPQPPPKKRAGDDAFLVTEVDFDESATVEYTSFAVYAL